MKPYELGACEALTLLRNRNLSCEELVRSCFERIEARDQVVRAWLSVDADLAVRYARDLDGGEPSGTLHGLPWGVKDIIETRDFPTTYNSSIYHDHRTGKDAACVASLRHCGSLILGKCDTVEFASGGRKALTRNPRNLDHTPGGSSSGSAAAVADKMVPLALATQSAGSLIRPAAFTGIYGLKPTFGLVNREGVRNYAPSLDTVGWYARSVADLRLVAQAFRFPGAGSSVPTKLSQITIGLCRTPMWNRAEPAGRVALLAAADRLAHAGVEVVDAELPPSFEGLPAAQHSVLHGEGRASFVSEYLGYREVLHDDFIAEAENALGITPQMLLDAYNLSGRCREMFDAMFGRSLHAILTLAAPGEAPLGLQTTGDWIFNGLWTLLHVPCIAIPAGRGPCGLPIGLQLVGPRFSDMLLLQIADAVKPLIDIDVQFDEDDSAAHL